MQRKTVHIKNMVCPRCIETVEGIFNDINIDISSIELGEVITQQEISKDQKEKLNKKLSERGFELLEDTKSKLIGKIKTLIINSIHYSKEPIYINLSNYLSDQLHHDYSYLSRLFSSVEGITIEKFVLSQKIEKVKELMFYDELTLSEIAFQMDYSSVAYLSSQFKKETGMTPTQFKNQKKPNRNHLDSF
ncbi:helix-turn-helix domain-containing protein [Psychroflexus sp. MES1-P1E]|uniref:helix-turn-helix domain-containing protein n=1 Tax=Psychroflexus sp. MES1-P1E TaxID=2058320 RepID=UPI000C7B6D60|nr:AraC family transcriptional regulator [Psychroflexus sp. MES1-P1E]PKG42893.1 AraC family transcriptional regulator [Psychroflexus sp. MES1-P1E]